ncbi:MAG: cytosine permease [Kiritimatiellae bacterium]|nr:cytosine permease [Kiritimatiellia bacterium]
MMTREEIVRKAAAIPAEERPVPQSRLSGLGDFLGIYGGEHIAATEFVIGALLVTWGVRAKELLFGLVVGNLLATCMYAFCTAPIAVDTRLSLFAYLRKAAGPWFQRVYNVAWGVTSIFYAAAMTAIASTSLKEAFGLPVQLEWYPTSAGSVALTLALAAVTVFVAAYGFKGVARFSSICAPWMITMFFCGAAVSLPALCRMTGFGPVGGAGDLLRLLETQVFTGKVPAGHPHLTWVHVAAFAWMCNLAYHAGLTDMSIFRYAKRKSYGWVGIYGMFVGHFFAWTCAGIMGATAAALAGKSLSQLDSGAVAGAVLGWTGLLAVVAAGWTTASPKSYRAALSFETFAPKASLRRLSFAVGAVIALCACFPVVMRIDKLVNAVVLVLPSVGAICLVEHWLFPRIGFVRYWNLYRRRKANPAALAAWLVSSAFVVVALKCDWMHPFFLFLPTFFIAGAAYLVLAGLCGAGRAVPEEVRRDVDAVEARIAELAEEDGDQVAEGTNGTEGTKRRRLPVFGILAAAMLAMLAVGAVCSPQRFKKAAVVYTALYFSFAAASAIAGRKTK